MLPGGEVERGGRLYRGLINGSDPLSPGRDYLVFMKLNARTNKIYLAYGTSGVYDVFSARDTPTST